MSESVETGKIVAGLMVEEGLETVVPLRAIKVQGKVSAFAAEVSVKQTYENLSQKAIEAMYIFPLPEESAITGLSIRAGERIIKGQVMDREEAFHKYDDAIWEGQGAALLDQNRPNVFQVAVGNIRPKERLDIEIRYVERLGFENGAYRFRLPTVVGPRYIPGVPDGDRKGHGVAEPTDRVPDADLITPPVADGDPGYSISLDLLFTMPMRIQSVESVTHPLKVEMMDSQTARVSLAAGEFVPDRDLVVLCRTEERVPAGALCHREKDKEGTVALVFHPTTFKGDAAPRPKAVVFVVDHSGSMSGKKMEQARNALRICLRSLNEGDMFNIIKFNDKYSSLSPDLLSYNQKNLTRADAWIKKIKADGGTEILEPLAAALRSFNDAPEQRFVVILTDGEVGNEKEILRMVEKEKGEMQIFTFGIDSAVNSYLLRELALAGRGQAEFITPWERVDDKVAAQFQRIGQPDIHEVRIDWGGLDIHDALPDPLPAIFAGEPLVLLARYRSAGRGIVSITGKGPRGAIHTALDLELPEVEERHSALPILWAREKIQHLERAKMKLSIRRQKEAERRIRELALKYGLMSQYTSYVAIEEREGEAPEALPEARMVPVSMPAGWGAVYFDADIGPQCQKALSLKLSPRILRLGESGVYKTFSAKGYMEQDIGILGEFAAPSPDYGEELLRILARNQSADGSWGKGTEEQIAATTALALLAFMGADDDVKRIHQSQIKKGFLFLEKLRLDADLSSSALVFWALMERAAREGKKEILMQDLRARASNLERSLSTLTNKEKHTQTLFLALLLAWKCLEGKSLDARALSWKDEWKSRCSEIPESARLKRMVSKLTKDRKFMPIPLLVQLINAATWPGVENWNFRQWLQTYMINKIMLEGEEALLNEAALAAAALAILDGSLFLTLALSELRV